MLLDKVRSGELSEKDYMRMVGWRDDPAILKDFNPKMLFWGGESQYGANHLVTQFDSPANQVPAMEKMEFIVSMNSMITPTARYRRYHSSRPGLDVGGKEHRQSPEDDCVDKLLRRAGQAAG